MWCRFPEVTSHKPGPKLRPALLLKIFQQTGGNVIVSVAYGTSQKTDTLFPGEFVIVKAEGAIWDLSGLSYTTKFDLGRVVQIPFNTNWFQVPPADPFGQSPKLGILHPALSNRVQTAWREVKK